MRLVSLVITAVAVALPLSAQEPFDFFARGPYRADVPRPDALLGYEAGATHTQYADQQRVLDAMIAGAGDRVRTEVIGATEEGRVMRVLIISAPENLARLDEIRANVARLADPRRTSRQEAQAIATRDPAVVLLSYSIHGNEPAGFEAAMWVAYHLLASNEPATLDMLRNTVVVLNPSANPDGHERFAVWYNSLAVGTDEPYAYEWNEPWGIWGRYGHYRFDMNRDFLAVSQAPVKAMLGAMMRWRPQVVVDHHSTTEQFFFPPVARPVNRNLPATSVRWFETFGQGNAAAFDRYGWQYYVRDIFDFFYIGYSDVAPSLHGAIGMTYETDGGKALKRRRDDRTVITFAEGIAHHFTASLATVETAAGNRTQLLRDYYEFHSTAIEEASAGRMKRIVILPENDPSNGARVAEILLRHGIEVIRSEEPHSSPSAHAYMAGPGATAARRTFPAGALVVDLPQAEGRAARALLEPDAELDPVFAQKQIERFQRNQRRGPNATTEGYEFYDVTAWSLPYSFGLEAYWTEDVSAVRGARLALPDTGEAVAALQPAGGVSGRARSAYVFPNDRQGAAKLAMALLREGFKLGMSTEALRADGRSHPRGTFIARTSRSDETLHARIEPLAVEHGVQVTAIQSAFPDSGQFGIGSESVRPTFAPRILVASGDGIGATSYGALWYWLERELEQPFVPVALEDIDGMYTMSDYNVLIVPDGSAGAVRRELGRSGIDRLKQWVRDGGVLITYGGTALFPGHEDVGLSSVKEVGDEEEDEEGQKGQEGQDSLPSGPELTPPLASPSADPDAPGPLPGTIFKATLDRSHWLTMGYERDALAVMSRGRTFLAPSEEGDNPVAFVGDSLLLAGFAWPENTEKALKNSVWAAVESQGRGQVVMLADDPLFRAFWRGPARLLSNAILFGPGK